MSEIEDAKARASQLWAEGMNKEDITRELNDVFPAVFFFTSAGIYAKNEPDYLPDRKILQCR